MTQDQLYAVIKEHPGTNYGELCRLLGLDSKEATRVGVSSALGTLVKNGRVRKQLPPGHKLRGGWYYPTSEEAIKAMISVPDTATRKASEPPSIAAPEPSTLDEIARLLGHRIAELLMGAVRAELDSQLLQLKEQLIESQLPRGSTKVQLPKVLIIGLLPAQAAMITGEFKDCLDLRFWKNGVQQQLFATARYMNHVIGMTDFMQHSDEEQVKKLPHYIRVGGGMTTLREKLTELYVIDSEEQT